MKPVAADGAAVEEAGPAQRAWRIAGQVPDPELPFLTLADLGILRGVEEQPDGSVVVTVTPTYSGCPAIREILHDVQRRLAAAGVAAEVRTVLRPAWTTDWVSAAGRHKLAEAGIAPPGPAPRTDGPVLLTLDPPVRPVRCPRCGSSDTEETARFSATACKSLHRCRSCREPFEHVKEL